MKGDNAMEEQLHPAYVQGLSARNRLTDARDAVYRLLDGLPMHKRIAMANLYSELCCIQGRLEKLLRSVVSP
jgi:hypothetical protein